MTVLRFFVESTFGRQRHSFLEDMGVGGRIVGFHIENLYIFWYNVNIQNYVFLTRETSENFLHITKEDSDLSSFKCIAKELGSR